MGGTLCVEIARQLQAMGRVTPSITLIDSYAPLSHHDLWAPANCVVLAAMLGGMLGRRLEVAQDEVAQVPREERFDFMLSKAESLGVVPSAGRPAYAFKQWLRLMLHASIAPLDVAASVLFAEQQLERSLSNTSSDWQLYLPRAVLTQVDGSHQTVHQGRLAMKISALLTKGMQEVRIAATDPG